MISCFDQDRSLWSRLSKPVTEPRPQGAVHPAKDLGLAGWVAYADVTLAHGVRVSAGESYSISTGNRPTRYYQPQARVVAWTAEWRRFGLTEKQYAYEKFRTHLFATGVRLGL